MEKKRKSSLHVIELCSSSSSAASECQFISRVIASALQTEIITCHKQQQQHARAGCCDQTCELLQNSIKISLDANLHMAIAKGNGRFSHHCRHRHLRRRRRCRRQVNCIWLSQTQTFCHMKLKYQNVL